MEIATLETEIWIRILTRFLSPSDARNAMSTCRQLYCLPYFYPSSFPRHFRWLLTKTIKEAYEIHLNTPSLRTLSTFRKLLCARSYLNETILTGLCHHAETSRHESDEKDQSEPVNVIGINGQLDDLKFRNSSLTNMLIETCSSFGSKPSTAMLRTYIVRLAMIIASSMRGGFNRMSTTQSLIQRCIDAMSFRYNEEVHPDSTEQDCEYTCPVCTRALSEGNEVTRAPYACTKAGSTNSLITEKELLRSSQQDLLQEISSHQLLTLTIPDANGDASNYILSTAYILSFIPIQKLSFPIYFLPQYPLDESLLAEYLKLCEEHKTTTNDELQPHEEEKGEESDSPPTMANSELKVIEPDVLQWRASINEAKIRGGCTESLGLLIEQWLPRHPEALVHCFQSSCTNDQEQDAKDPLKNCLKESLSDLRLSGLSTTPLKLIKTIDLSGSPRLSLESFFTPFRSLRVLSLSFDGIFTNAFPDGDSDELEGGNHTERIQRLVSSFSLSSLSELRHLQSLALLNVPSESIVADGSNSSPFAFLSSLAPSLEELTFCVKSSSELQNPEGTVLTYCIYDLFLSLLDCDLYLDHSFQSLSEPSFDYARDVVKPVAVADMARHLSLRPINVNETHPLLGIPLAPRIPRTVVEMLSKIPCPRNGLPLPLKKIVVSDSLLRWPLLNPSGQVSEIPLFSVLRKRLPLLKRVLTLDSSFNPLNCSPTLLPSAVSHVRDRQQLNNVENTESETSLKWLAQNYLQVENSIRSSLHTVYLPYSENVLSNFILTRGDVDRNSIDTMRAESLEETMRADNNSMEWWNSFAVLPHRVMSKYRL